MCMCVCACEGERERFRVRKIRNGQKRSRNWENRRVGVKEDIKDVRQITGQSTKTGGC